VTPPATETLASTVPPEPVKAPAAAASGMSLARLRQGGLLFGASQIVAMVLGFAGTMVLTRAADTAAVASYLLLVQSTITVGLVLQLGLAQATLRFVPVSRGEGGRAATSVLRRRLLGLQVGMWLLAAPILFLVWPGVAWRLDAPELSYATAFLIGIPVLASLGQLMDSYLRAFRMYSVSAPLTQVLPRVLVLAGFLTLWLAMPGSATWEMLASVYTLSLILTLLGYAAAMRATTPAEESEPRTAQTPPGVRTILSTTTAMGLRSAASVLFVSSDLWILSWARPHEEVAIYGVASRLIQVMAALPGIASFLLPQEFAVLYADGRKEEMERLARQASTAMAMISVAAFIGLLLLGKPLLGIAFDDVYARGWTVVLILAVGTFWDTASGASGFALQMTGHHVRLLVLTAGAAALNVLLSVLLVPIWGGHGIALATAVTLIALNTAMVWSARKLVGVRTFIYLRPAEWKQVIQKLIRREKPL
jgi:O-antigen/teichoic acid export membrane protein